MHSKSEPAGKNVLHVAFCVDNHYFRSMGATIASLLDNNPQVQFVFHVFAFAVADEHRRRLRQLEQKFGVATHIHLIDPARFSEFSHFIASTYYSPSIFTRLLIPSVLRDVTDKVLYLDADILCVGKVDELLQRDMDGVVALVVPDAEATTVRRVAALKLSQPKYFNSGVMLMNVPLWLEQRITEQAVDVDAERRRPRSALSRPGCPERGAGRPRPIYRAEVERAVRPDRRPGKRHPPHEAAGRPAFHPFCRRGKTLEQLVPARIARPVLQVPPDVAVGRHAAR